MDFNAWFEAFLGGKWLTFDARHNMPRIGRILIARTRRRRYSACQRLAEQMGLTGVGALRSFGPHILKSFRVWTEEASSAAAA